ncbi:MAG TPA: BTAD domain-containing putative transcriptional regulator [Polyangiaceae bacterium]|nr:BTAD domain-containing putative transcriptional regulator [Polyangiaceae bacterium]
MRKKRALKKSVVAPAKISMPRPMAMYPRERLLRALDVARRKPITWVAAPAGTGKTSAVTAYIQKCRLPTLWYNVDARDADVANLFHYLALAAQFATPRRRLRLPQFQAENRGDVGAFAQNFFEALCRQRPAPSFIVFDDYHEAQSGSWDGVIREAVSVVPKGVSVIFISRLEPPPALARRMASGDMATLGMTDLRLTAAEVGGLVRMYRPDFRLSRIKLVLPRLMQLANGWAAALVLLLQNNHLEEMEAHHIEQFSDRLFDYFAQEILDKATPLQRDFLLKTSILPSFSVKLAETLIGSPGAGRILGELARGSLLTHRLGSSGAYRYHPLLRGFLERRAESELGRARLQELHRTAAAALVEAEQIDDAMEQFEKAGEVSVRAKLLALIAPSYIAKGRAHTIESWIARFPVAYVERDGWLLYWQGVCCLGHSPSRSRELLERAVDCFAQEQNDAGMYCASASAMQAIVHEGVDYGRLDGFIQRFDQLQSSGRLCPPALEPMVATGMFMALLFRRPGSSECRQWAERARRLALASEDVGHRVMTGGLLAQYYTFHDQLGAAAAILEMLRATARADDASALCRLTLLQAEAMYILIRGDNRGCIEMVREGLALATRAGVVVWSDYLCASGTAAALGAEDLDAAREFLELMAGTAQRGSRFAFGNYHFYAGWEALLRGDRARALHSAELSRDSAEELRYPFACSITNLALAQVHWQSGRAPQAQAHLDLARERAQEIGSAILMRCCDLVEADVAWEEDRPRALSCLERGLTLARERGYFDTFWLRKAQMGRFALRALEHAIEPEHVRVLIAKHSLVPDVVPVRIEAWPWRFCIRAFGGLEVFRDDGKVAPPGRAGGRGRQKVELRGLPSRLLQRIVARGGRGISDGELMDALWPDAEGDAARRVFDTTLHRLRKQLGHDGVVRLSAGKVSLDDRICWTDVAAFEATLAEVEGDLARGAATVVLQEHARRLLTIYRGPLFEHDSRAEAWISGPRQRFALKFLHVSEELGRALEDAGSYSEATNLYKRSLEVDHHVETVYAGLMRCAVGIGHRADALRWYDAYQVRLSQTMTVEPGPEMTELRARISMDSPA